MAPSRLQIQINALERLLKEKKLYSRDVDDGSYSLDEMKKHDPDAYEIKKGEEILRESQRMVAEIERKIESSKNALAQFLDNYSGDENLDAATELLARC